MSEQHPFPYQPPPIQPMQGAVPGQGPYGGSARNPFKGPAIVLIVLAVIWLAGGVCAGGMSFLVQKAVEERPELLEELQKSLGPQATVRVIRVGMLVMGGVVLAGGLVQAVLAIFMFRASRVAATLAIVFGLVVLIFCGLNIGTAVAAHPEQAGGTVCLMGVPMLMYAGMIAWIIYGMRQPRLDWEAEMAAYQRRYAEYLEKYHAYQQGAANEGGEGGR